MKHSEKLEKRGNISKVIFFEVVVKIFLGSKMALFTKFYF